MKRYAIVRNADRREQLEAYLPSNYRVIWESWADGKPSMVRPGVKPNFVIEGTDDHGWTLDGYVIPRLASGLIWAEEIDLSHPLMKRVPA